MNNRSFENHSTDLQNSIIQASLNKEFHNKEETSSNWLGNILSPITIPKSALALTLLFVLGVAGGFYYSSNMDPTQATSEDGVLISELIYYQEAFYE